MEACSLAPLVTSSPQTTSSPLRPLQKQPTRILPPREKRRQPANRWADESMSATYAGLASVGEDFEEPRTFKVAMQSSKSSDWMAAMEDELVSLDKNETWIFTEPPPYLDVIQCRWVYKLKRSGTGAMLRFKARQIVKGFTQRAGINYEETYSPVVKNDSLRTVLALSASMDLEIIQLDVKTVFLYGDLQEEFYMAQPVGLVKPKEEHLV